MQGLVIIQYIPDIILAGLFRQCSGSCPLIQIQIWITNTMNSPLIAEDIVCNDDTVVTGKSIHCWKVGKNTSSYDKSHNLVNNIKLKLPMINTKLAGLDFQKPLFVFFFLLPNENEDDLIQQRTPLTVTNYHYPENSKRATKF